MLLTGRSARFPDGFPSLFAGPGAGAALHTEESAQAGRGAGLELVETAVRSAPPTGHQHRGPQVQGQRGTLPNRGLGDAQTGGSASPCLVAGIKLCLGSVTMAILPSDLHFQNTNKQEILKTVN